MRIDYEFTPKVLSCAILKKHSLKSSLLFRELLTLSGSPAPALTGPRSFDQT
jgi:hypothetical protein